MNVRTHAELATFIWGICNLLRGPYKRNEYRKVILPLTVLRRFDCLLAPTKSAVLEMHETNSSRREPNVLAALLRQASSRPFYNTSPLDFARLLDDPNHLAQNLNAYIKDFSPNAREIMERFAFDVQIARLDEKDLLFQVVQEFAKVDLSPDRVDNVQMGYVFEELIRIGSEQANEEAGEHFTPREVIRLMVSLLLSPEPDLGKAHVVKTIYDPACGTGGMLSVAEDYLREHNSASNPILYGQDLNDEAWAVCKSDMLIKGENAERIILGDSFTADGYARRSDGRKHTFDYMLANPPFGVEWKQQEHAIKQERDTLGYEGRFGAGLPRINDGSLLFLQHMLAKMQPAGKGGSRIAIVFNGSPLFTGDAGSGESDIRRWIIESDWLEAIVALPDQLFYNTGISTYIWVLTNRKEPRRQGQGAAHRRAPVLREDAQEPGQQAQRAVAGADRRPDTHPRQLRGRRDARPQRRGPGYAPAAHAAVRSKQGLRERGVRLPQSDGGATTAPQLFRHPAAHRANRGREGVPEPRAGARRSPGQRTMPRSSEGQARQEAIRGLLRSLAKARRAARFVPDREAFSRGTARQRGKRALA